MTARSVYVDLVPCAADELDAAGARRIAACLTAAAAELDSLAAAEGQQQGEGQP